MSKHEWWRDFFTGAPVDLWLQATTDAQTRSEVEFISKTLRLEPVSTVLDVPCGGGRHAIELAAGGHAVTGVDFSSEFLGAARKAAATREVNVTWLQREMRELEQIGPFDGALCFGNSFGYLDDAGNAEFLAAVARVLKPGARLVIESHMLAESILPSLQERDWYPIGNMHFLIENWYEPAEARLHTNYTFVRDGAVEMRSGSHRVYTFRELVELLTQAGFDDRVEVCGSLTGEPFRLGSRQLLLTARVPVDASLRQKGNTRR